MHLLERSSGSAESKIEDPILARRQVPHLNGAVSGRLIDLRSENLDSAIADVCLRARQTLRSVKRVGIIS